MVNPSIKTDWESLSEKEILNLVKKIYHFLPPPITITLEERVVTIQSPFETQTSRRTTKLFERANAEASHGRYTQAVSLFEQFLNSVPDNVDARRNLGMAHLEMGNVPLAEKHILEAYHLNPEDAYSLLLLGNIYLDKKKEDVTADSLYQRAVQTKPNDPYILSNVAALLARREQYAEAQRHFRQAITADPTFPNAHYGLALTYFRQEEHQAALDALNELFAHPESMDIRSEPVYAEARRLYSQINRVLAQSMQESSMEHVHQWRDELEEQGGIEIEMVNDNRIDTQAVAQIAWHGYGRKNHVIRYRDVDPLITPHLLAHELQHITLEQNARATDRNRFYRTTNQTRESAYTDIGRDINDLKRKGLLSGDQLNRFIDRILTGMANQIFNAPLDMIIEYFLYQEHPRLHPSQYLSLQASAQENKQVLTQPDLKRLTPRLVYNANVSLNAAYALFVDHLLGSTDYTADYNAMSQLRTGRQLFGLWQETMQDYQPGDEYTLVDEFAAVLKLQNWYEWQKDEPLPSEEAGGPTNPELLRSKDMASVMYCLSALQHFENMSRDKIFAIVSEIAILGQSGLDYASPDKKYKLNSLPGETFSGLQLLCLMYVGFKDIEPTVDVGVDLQEPYELALKMHSQ